MTDEVAAVGSSDLGPGQRSTAELRDLPPNVLAFAPAEMRRLGYWVVDQVVDHFEHGADRPAVRVGTPGSLRVVLGGPPPNDPGDPLAAMQDLVDVALALRPARPARPSAAAPPPSPALSAHAASVPSMADLVRCHRSVLRTSVAIVSRVRAFDLELPTPCAGWTLRHLLAHMIGQNYGFAAAAEASSQDLASFADRTVGDQPAAAYATSARRVIEAFSAPGLVERSMYLPEVRGGMSFPASTAIGFHLVDSVAHGWDVAKSVGVTANFDEDALQVALTIAESVPDEAKSLDDRAPFRPTVPTTSTRLLERVVATLGRSPDWTSADWTSAEARCGGPP